MDQDSTALGAIQSYTVQVVPSKKPPPPPYSPKKKKSHITSQLETKGRDRRRRSIYVSRTWGLQILNFTVMARKTWQ